MIVLVVGGIASGKSLVGENIAVTLSQGLSYGGGIVPPVNRGMSSPMVYMATLDPLSGGDTTTRIEKHQRERAHKGFKTIEYPYSILSTTHPWKDVIDLSRGSVCLLEDMDNLVCNTLYCRERTTSTKSSTKPLDTAVAVKELYSGVLALEEMSNAVVIVAGNIGEGYALFNADSLSPLAVFGQTLGDVLQKVASYATLVIEVVSGIECYIASYGKALPTARG